MKKSTLALSVAAALGGLGFVGSALAMGAITLPATTTLSVNPDGIGHQLVIPYFSAQADNATLFNVTNTDLVNGKVVKVRFRGAANSDDLYDFTLLLSPGDVFTAAVTKDAATGLAKLTSSDASCVLPASAKNATFATTRVDSASLDKPAQTREGYVEVLTMADVAPGNALYTTIKHVNNVAPCNAAALETALGSDVADDAAALARGMTPPTGGLTGDWIILNQSNTAAWSGAATALVANTAGVSGPAALVFWPQKFGTPTIALAGATADPLLAQGLVAVQNYDLPDLSTPTVAGDTTAVVRADKSATTLSIKSMKHQIVTTSDIAAVTDVVLSQPTRRYAVAVNYASGAAVYRTIPSTIYTAVNTSVTNRQVCINNVNAPDVNAVFNREETTPTVGSTSFVISPNVPSAATVLLLCGETSVVSINQGGNTLPSGALNGSVARSDVTFAAGYEAGWATWDLNVAPNLGFPVIGQTFMRARNGAVNYGFAFPVKAVR